MTHLGANASSIKRGPTWEPAHMRACEVRWILTLGRVARQKFFDSVERIRGADELKSLIRRVDAEIKSRKNSRTERRAA